MSEKVVHLSTLSQSTKSLKTTALTTDCPVEMIVTVGEKILDSCAVVGRISNEYAAMEISGEGQSRKVQAVIDHGNQISV